MNRVQYVDMKVAILGFGVEGKSSARYWSRKGAQITVCDKDTSIIVPDEYNKHLGEKYLVGLDEYDLIVRSPGIHPRKITEQYGPKILEHVTTNVNEFFNVSPTRNVIGVTGTKGKGTTSSLIASILKRCGYVVKLGGNIGLACLDLLNGSTEADGWIVLELSNFQLIDLKHSPTLGVCLLVEPEHLDWHQSTEEYVEAKQHLFKWQSRGDTAVYYPASDLSKKVVSATTGRKIPYFIEPGAHIEHDNIVIEDTIICAINETKLLGKHNLQNVCAAVTVTWQITKDVEHTRKAIASFRGLPFRLELRATKNNIHYYNDSFASQPDATVAAIESISAPKVMIIGGYDRKLDLGRLARTVVSRSGDIKKVVLIGNSAKRLADALSNLGYDNYVMETAKTMDDILRTAKSFASKGDAVVLSPGFPSFDMFKNFEDRGEKFNEAVADA